MVAARRVREPAHARGVSLRVPCAVRRALCAVRHAPCLMQLACPFSPRADVCRLCVGWIWLLSWIWGGWRWRRRHLWLWWLLTHSGRRHSSAERQNLVQSRSESAAGRHNDRLPHFIQPICVKIEDGVEHTVVTRQVHARFIELRVGSGQGRWGDGTTCDRTP